MLGVGGGGGGGGGRWGGRGYNRYLVNKQTDKEGSGKDKGKRPASRHSYGNMVKPGPRGLNRGQTERDRSASRLTGSG